MMTILLIILVLILVGALPTWPYSSGWDYLPERRYRVGGADIGRAGGDGADLTLTTARRGIIPAARPAV